MVKKITEKQKKYILQHRDIHPRRKIAECAGVSLRVVYEVISRYSRESLTPKIPDLKCRDIVKQYWPTITLGEMEKKFGYSRTKILVWKKRLGVEHNEETMKRIKQNKVRVITENRENSDPGLMVAHWKRTRKMDEFRILGGEVQKTNFKFRKRPIRIMRAISHLIHKYNYFRDEEVGGLYTLFYDGDTKRTKNEEYFNVKYGIDFKRV